MPPQARVRKAAQYQVVLRRGRRTGRSEHFVLMRATAEPEPGDVVTAAVAEARLGLIVGKRNAARAVTRNAVKRVWREAFRLQRASLPAGDYVARLAMRLPELSLRALKRQVRAEADTLLRQVRRSGGSPGQGGGRLAGRSSRPTS